MQRGLTHGAENGARSVLAGNVERIDGNAEKRQAKFAFRAFCKDVTAGRRRQQEGGLVRERGALRLSAGGKGGPFRLQCASAAPVGRGRRTAEFSPALRGIHAFEVAGGASSALWNAAGARGASGRGSPGGLMRKTDARRKASGALLRLRGGPCGARSSGPSATRIRTEQQFSEKAGLAGSAFFIARAGTHAGLLRLKDAQVLFHARQAGLRRSFRLRTARCGRRERCSGKAGRLSGAKGPAMEEQRSGGLFCNRERRRLL